MSRAGTENARSARERRALLAARTLVDRVRGLYRDLEQTTGAPITAHRVLACLGEQQGLAASQLAVALGLQRPALSQVLKGLVERGWVERVRDDADQRSVHVYLTVLGRQVLAATAGRAAGTLQRAVRQLSRNELEGLAVGIEKVLSHLPAPPSSRSRARTPGATRRHRRSTGGRAAVAPVHLGAKHRADARVNR